jgi:uncharacterized protein
MLTIPLARLEREGTLEIRAAIPAEDPCWEGTDFVFSTPLEVSGRAQWVSSGEIVARVSVRGQLAQECRLCLEPVDTDVDEELTLVFGPDVDEEVGDDEVRPLPAGDSELDLTGPIREEVILTQSPLAQCKPECLGLCPKCGANLNEKTCQCQDESTDPRWDALRALGDE